MNSSLGDMINYKESFEVLSSVATAAAAIATFVTVREMKRSRKDSINPDLYIEKGSIIYSSLLEGNQYFFHEESKFNLCNLGNGSAKDINIIWKNDTINRIKKLGYSAVPEKNVDHISVKHPKKLFLFNLAKEQSVSLNFILGREKSISGFLMNPTAMELLQLESWHRFDKSDDDIVMFDINPSDNSFVRIEYLDLLNKIRVEKFNITTKVTIFRQGQTHLIGKIRYDFSFQRVAK